MLLGDGTYIIWAVSYFLIVSVSNEVSSGTDIDTEIHNHRKTWREEDEIEGNDLRRSRNNSYQGKSNNPLHVNIFN